MSFYNYLINVVEELKKTWEESRAVVEVYGEPEIELTDSGVKLRDDVIEFYNRQIESSVTKDSLKDYNDKLSRTYTLPNAFWNKKSLCGRKAYMNTLWFIAFWDGNVDELLLD